MPIFTEVNTEAVGEVQTSKVSDLEPEEIFNVPGLNQMTSFNSRFYIYDYGKTRIYSHIHNSKTIYLLCTINKI